MNRRWAVLLGIAGTLNLAAGETRVKDVARVGGARDLELVGYGLVTGLRGTGDRPGSGPAAQSLVNLLNRLGVAASPQELQSSNIAAVAVTARVPAFSRPGAASDARVSSLGNASRLEGGTLLLTALLGVDGKAYATAQGRLAEEPEAGPGQERGHFKSPEQVRLQAAEAIRGSAGQAEDRDNEDGRKRRPPKRRAA
jgi:flagellar P-ring protein precursor FlgI